MQPLYSRTQCCPRLKISNYYNFGRELLLDPWDFLLLESVVELNCQEIVYCNPVDIDFFKGANLELLLTTIF